MQFLGIDLGWVSGASGLCCLQWRPQGELYLSDLQCQATLAGVLAWVNQQVPEGDFAGIAIDAPTIIPNLTGMRLCDRKAHSLFGRYHAGCYPANLGLPFAQRLIGFAQTLETMGFAHAPDMVAQQPERFQAEVFPHPAMVHLFGLDRIIKYKKGRLAERRLELARMRELILTHLPHQEPALCITSDDLPTIPERALALKAVEDQLDSLICAYVAAHWWYWGLERNWVLGNREEGFLVVPAPPIA
jgi:predicted RNase H-like nuclease